jgi:hypothetical protein
MLTKLQIKLNDSALQDGLGAFDQLSPTIRRDGRAVTGNDRNQIALLGSLDEPLTKGFLILQTCLKDSTDYIDSSELVSLTYTAGYRGRRATYQRGLHHHLDCQLAWGRNQHLGPS